MKNLLLILTILISSVGYSQTEVDLGDFVSIEEVVMGEYKERCKTPYLYSENKGNDTIDYRNFNEGLVEYLILKKINDYRISKGLGILVEDTLLKDLSKGWSITMDTTNTFQHNPELPAMECIHINYGGEEKKTYNEVAEESFQIWKNSKGHNAVMLLDDSHYGSIGVSYSFKESDVIIDKYGNNLTDLFNLKGAYKMYVTFNSVSYLGHL